jgi:hypothetical protein
MFEELSKALTGPYFLIVCIVAGGIYAAVRGWLDRKKPDMQQFANGGSNPLGIPSWLIIGPMQKALDQFTEACEKQRSVSDAADRFFAESLKIQGKKVELLRQQCTLLEQIHDDTKKFGMTQDAQTRLLIDMRNDMLIATHRQEVT